MSWSRSWAFGAMAFMLVATACKPTTIYPKNDDDDGTPSNTHIALPPPVKSSAVYRCDDNAVIYVDFLADGVTANLRSGSETAPLTKLVAAIPGAAFEGAGYSLKNTGGSVQFAAPHKKSVVCKS